LMYWKDTLELTIEDEKGNSIPNKKYKFLLPTGEIRTGTLDGQGKVSINNVPPGEAIVKVTL